MTGTCTDCVLGARKGFPAWDAPEGTRGRPQGGEFRVGKALGLGRSGSGTLRRDGSGRAVLVPQLSWGAGQEADDGSGCSGDGGGGEGGGALCPSVLWNCRFNAGRGITIKATAAPEVFPQECAIHVTAAARLGEQLATRQHEDAGSPAWGPWEGTVY